jgi:hypothetical protein
VVAAAGNGREAGKPHDPPNPTAQIAAAVNNPAADGNSVSFRAPAQL